MNSMDRSPGHRTAVGTTDRVGRSRDRRRHTRHSARPFALHALDAEDGARVWTFELGSRRQGFHSEQPLVHTDVVFAVNDGVLHALDLRTARSAGAPATAP